MVYVSIITRVAWKLFEHRSASKTLANTEIRLKLPCIQNGWNWTQFRGKWFLGLCNTDRSQGITPPSQSWPQQPRSNPSILLTFAYKCIRPWRSKVADEFILRKIAQTRCLLSYQVTTQALQLYVTSSLEAVPRLRINVFIRVCHLFQTIMGWFNSNFISWMPHNEIQLHIAQFHVTDCWQNICLSQIVQDMSSYRVGP